MIPLRSDVITYAQFLAGDPNGVIFVDNASPPAGQVNIGNAFGGAYRELVTSYDFYQAPAAIFEVWTNLPAYTSILNPVSQALALNFQQPRILSERDIATTINVTNATVAAGGLITLTFAAQSLSAAGISAATEILVSGVGGVTGADGRFFPTIVDDTDLTLNGSIGSGSYTSGGVVTTSNDNYTAVKQVTELADRFPSLRLWEYTFENGNFYFVGATQARQLRLSYFASGLPPTTGSVGYDDSLDFLAHRTAALACDAIQSARSATLHVKASGYLGTLMTQAVRELQRNPVRPRAYKSGGYIRSVTNNPSGTILPG